uniref:Uncharacterized protein n=1 Tax=Aegilops tauschii TaxID=37682 RepID=R7WAI1_AEGTA
MGMEHLMSVVNPSSGYILQRGLERRGDGTMEEKKDLQKQRTERRMMEDYQNTESRDGAIRCPIPCKSSRPYRDYDFKSAQDISDFMVSKLWSKLLAQLNKQSDVYLSFNQVPLNNSWFDNLQASPPYFMGSPPVRASNPLVNDRQFCAWKVQSVDESHSNTNQGLPRWLQQKGRVCYRGLKLHLSVS